MENSIWDEVDKFIEDNREKYNMSFGLEYSSVVDWVCDFTPRRNHPQCREYESWRCSGMTRDSAIRNAMQETKERLGII